MNNILDEYGDYECCLVNGYEFIKGIMEIMSMLASFFLFVLVFCLHFSWLLHFLFSFALWFVHFLNWFFLFSITFCLGGLWIIFWIVFSFFAFLLLLLVIQIFFGNRIFISPGFVLNFPLIHLLLEFNIFCLLYILAKFIPKFVYFFCPVLVFLELLKLFSSELKVVSEWSFWSVSPCFFC